ncbi:MAG: hypothetical protein J7K94_01545 [Dehalococcoidia bacterium]|nr:hypothetical protein [Dehalococcoidia bacterium]
MVVINKKRVRGEIKAIKEKLAAAGREREGISEITKLLEVKDSSLQQVDSCAACCGSSCSIAFLLEAEIEILRSALEAIKANDTSRAGLLLEAYLDFLENNYENAPAFF